MSHTADPLIVLLSTFPDALSAQAAADALVTQGVAACVQIGGPIRTTYRWEGKLEHGTEYPLQAKPVETRRQAAIALIQAMHPYEVPEILIVPILGGLPAYCEWVAESCHRGNPSARA